jgi:3-dehydroquinate synthase
MRGIAFGFVPTTLLAMVDASIGGKNGIDVGIYKNMVGAIRQPSFILWDFSFLSSLPRNEWNNGFAEIIKHACIKDRIMFLELEKRNILFFQNKKAEIAALVERNAMLKTRVVQKDQFEKGDRKLLNFGHTLGHALENQYELSHGEAISIGMTFATKLSGELLHFKEEKRVVQLLEKYDLPTDAKFNKSKVFHALKKDKKKQLNTMHFILLSRIGKAVITPIPIEQLKDSL